MFAVFVSIWNEAVGLLKISKYKKKIPEARGCEFLLLLTRVLKLSENSWSVFPEEGPVKLTQSNNERIRSDIYRYILCLNIGYYMD